MKRSPLILLSAAFILLVASPPLANASSWSSGLAIRSPLHDDDYFSGRYYAVVEGSAMELTIRQSDDALEGGVVEGDYQYILTAVANGKEAQGQLHDLQTGGVIPIEMSVDGDRLTLTMEIADQFTGEVDHIPVRFQRADKGGGRDGQSHMRAAPSEDEHDPNIVGVWSRQEIMSGGGHSVATQFVMVLRSEGTGVQGDARTVGGGAGWSGDTGYGGAKNEFEWRTENGQVYGRQPGTDQWAHLGRYHIEGNRLLLTPQHGEQELWYRQ